MGVKEYKSSEQLERERAIADALEILWDVQMIKLPTHYVLDFAMCDQHKRARGWCEIKGGYKHSFAELEKFGGYTINLNKIEKAHSLMRLTGLEFRIVVDAGDEVWAAVFKTPPYVGEVRVFGRKDRPDKNDQEPNIKLPLSLFKKLPITIRDKSNDATKAA